ncbi:protein UL30 [Cercopithecine betaherpesvirus 5]|uniref:Protein UL30 n=1 Tax=Simian cytomegalovirus (strain Colburn) TaxID=50292 RepID=G8XTA2_SCMVC|nr:protein UL30 [Cercopithecine betaherpesvirus 5]AEV80395.1 protein UL30 [Cercopithecine betaherpesvirus 5]AEV80577.1 protein UL30 [Cercopithecine betaherpesvirus 5]
MSERRRHLESLKSFMRGSVAVIDVERMLDYYHNLPQGDQLVFWKTAEDEVQTELNKDEVADEPSVLSFISSRWDGL